MSGSFAFLGCDAGSPRVGVPAGPPILVTGLNIDDATPMPADGVVQIGVSRYLLPESVSRQSVLLTEADGTPVRAALSPNVLYDPIARSITLTRPSDGQPWLLPGTTYGLHLPVSGLTAIDGAHLAPAQRLDFAFRVGPAVTTPQSLQGSLGEPTNVSFCRDVLPIFVTKCSSSLCHGVSVEGGAAAGLVLDSSEGVATTAIRATRIANGSNTGPAAGAAPSEQTKFGIDMPLVQPGSPGNSWLLYKMELGAVPINPAPAPTVSCRPSDDPTPKQDASYRPLAPVYAAGDMERGILSDSILGREMPYPVLGTPSYATQALTFQERETMRMWIGRGAPTPECGSCAVVLP